MQHQADAFNGVIISAQNLPEDVAVFAEKLAALLAQSERDGKQLIWLTLPLNRAHFTGIATELGFVFHNCLEAELTLIKRLRDDAFAPFVPSHTLGAGGLVEDGEGRFLAIREQGMTGFKLPGGHVEVGETLEAAVQREVWEETGIETRFESVLGFATKHPYRFGKSNAYFVCKLTPLSSQLAIQDTDEIAEARWLSIDAFVADEQQSLFNRQLVGALAGKSGLAKIDLDGNDGPHQKAEVFFAF
ncbi:DNA mismatch repair protein MutT [Saccharospirillum sp. MSK14-1]|nr:DNA mismatch repair protein MutT [Saccharospirillum sp. MSK14-1]